MADLLNGHLTQGVDETVPFVIGREAIQVPVLNLWVMQQCKKELLELGPGLDFISYAANVVHIIHAALRNSDPTLAISEPEMMKKCSLKEVRDLPRQMNELLRASGLEDAESDPLAPPAEQPGTGTSTASSQSLPPPEFAAEISGGLPAATPSSGVKPSGEPG